VNPSAFASTILEASASAAMTPLEATRTSGSASSPGRRSTPPSCTTNAPEGLTNSPTKSSPIATRGAGPPDVLEPEPASEDDASAAGEPEVDVVSEPVSSSPKPSVRHATAVATKMSPHARMDPPRFDGEHRFV